VPHIQIAHDMGLGCGDLAKVDVHISRRDARGVRILAFFVAALLAVQVLPWRAAARDFLG
jgi:hypothetical protein